VIIVFQLSGREFITAEFVATRLTLLPCAPFAPLHIRPRLRGAASTFQLRASSPWETYKQSGASAFALKSARKEQDIYVPRSVSIESAATYFETRALLLPVRAHGRRILLEINLEDDLAVSEIAITSLHTRRIQMDSKEIRPEGGLTMRVSSNPTVRTPARIVRLRRRAISASLSPRLSRNWRFSPVPK
jgi:hypothetical protein